MGCCCGSNPNDSGRLGRRLSAPIWDRRRWRRLAGGVRCWAMIQRSRGMAFAYRREFRLPSSGFLTRTIPGGLCRRHRPCLYDLGCNWEERLHCRKRAIPGKRTQTGGQFLLLTAIEGLAESVAFAREQFCHGDANLLRESAKVVQQTAAVNLGGIAMPLVSTP